MAAGLCAIAAAAVAARPVRSFAEMSIEELLNEPVTSVAKKETTVFASPAAISILTGDDVAREGITSLPEALRLVPGMAVARIRANQWAVSARGFNDEYAGKLLVLVDGRTIYTPSFGGVRWDTQNLLLEDLDRIEVIRGPGATLWGANAVNGVINFTSKDAAETQGALVSSTVAGRDGHGGAVRYGGAAGRNVHYRVYAQSFAGASLPDLRRPSANDAWDFVQAGFRADWRPTTEDLLTLQGDAYQGHRDESVRAPAATAPFRTDVSTENGNRGANVLARWTRADGDASRFSLQGYFDDYRHGGTFTYENRHTADVQLEQRLRLASRHDVVWGASYRFSSARLLSNPLAHWQPERDDLHLVTAFAQDEIALAPERLSVTVGSKFEHTSFTGLEVQPSVRALWRPAAHHAVWASVSRAVSTPAEYTRRGDLGVALPVDSPVPVITTVYHNPDTESETLTAIELGYRAELRANVSLDIAAFHNAYARTLRPVPGEPQFVATPSPHLLMPLTWQNVPGGDTAGAEVSLRWKPLAAWHVSASYSYLDQNWRYDAVTLRANPRHQASLRSHVTLSRHWEFTSSLQWVDAIVAQHADALLRIPAYLRCDAGLVWRATDTLEIGVWGRNLLDRRHPEFTAYNTGTIAEIPRTLAARITWRF